MQAPLRDKNDIKIFILYLLKNLKYPLDFNTISDIVVQDEFVNYFDFAECFAELLDSGTIEQIRVQLFHHIDAVLGDAVKLGLLLRSSI